jgi:hypothetical protein
LYQDRKLWHNYINKEKQNITPMPKKQEQLNILTTRKFDCSWREEMINH